MCGTAYFYVQQLQHSSVVSREVIRRTSTFGHFQVITIEFKMACVAVQQMPRAGVFRGDAQELVDALIEASRIPVVSKHASPSLVGRELVPWVPDEGAPLQPSMHEALEGKTGHFASLSPRKFNGDSRKSPNKRGKAGNRVSSSGSAAESYSTRGISRYANPTAFTCPALASAPRPEAVPMPSGLLSRAASRSRSPSPPKYVVESMQHLIYPVAA